MRLEVRFWEIGERDDLSGECELSVRSMLAKYRITLGVEYEAERRSLVRARAQQSVFQHSHS